MGKKTEEGLAKGGKGAKVRKKGDGG